MRWLNRSYEGLGLLVVIVLAPIAALYLLVTGELGQALLAVAILVVALVVAAAGIRRARR